MCNSSTTQIFIALGTWMLAALAIWGEGLRNYFFGPKLQLSVVDYKGERIEHKNSEGHKINAYCYFLKLTNQRPSILAKNIQVILTQISPANANGDFEDEELNDQLEIKRPYQTVPSKISVGKNSLSYELGTMVKDTPFELATFIKPVRFQELFISGMSVKIKAKAIGENAESNEISIKISWNGKWDEDKEKMSHHLVLTKIPETT